MTDDLHKRDAVKRWQPQSEYEPDEVWMGAQNDGGWVKYDDYAALLARLEAVTQDRGKWFEGAGAHHVASMREAQRADRALAEVARLQAKLAKAVEFTGSVVRYAGNCGDDYLAEQARAALAAQEG